MEWIGRCIFYERWAAVVEDQDPEEDKLGRGMHSMERI